VLRADAAHHPSRLFANALGERGVGATGPSRTFTPAASMGTRSPSGGVTPSRGEGADAVGERWVGARDDGASGARRERPERPWPEQVLPYGLASMMLITPRAGR